MTPNRFASLLRLCLFSILLAGMVFQPQSNAYAAANLTITPLTWNVVGLDSNNVNVGPNNFPVGARVCNTGDTTATNVSSTFNWEAVDPTPAKNYIALRPGSNTSYSGYTLAPSACVDFYYEVQVTRNSNAYEDTRRYYITAAADTLATISTPRPREIFVEHLISQNRNAVTDVKLNGVSIAAGGTMSLIVGNTYTIQLVGSTATQGYEQLESFINFPNTIFQVNSVTSTYSANAGTDPLATTRPYANGCNWVNDPGSPNYRSCVGTGKYGGNITVTYNVTILGGAGTTQTLNTLIYDFSGSSYHYNADFSTGARFASIIGPSSIEITKTFSPRAISPFGTSVLTFKLTNPTTETITGVNFTDSLLGGLKVAAIPNVSYSGCGAGAFSPAPVANATSLNFSNGTLAPNSTCTITVTVTADTAADYPNTTGHLFINGSVDTGNSASDTLKVSSASACVPGQILATWTFPSSSVPATPAPAFQAGNVDTADASTNVIAPTIETNIGSPAPSWSGRNFPANGAVTGDTSPYFQFVIDTSDYSSVQVSLSYSRDSNWGGGSATTPTIYVWSSTTGGLGSFSQIFSSSATPFDTTFRSTGNLNAAATSSNLTYFRINAVGATNANSFMQIDTVTFTGCLVPAPAPTLAKSFLTDPIIKGATSTLMFTINNTAAGNVAQSGISFTDVLPDGLSVTNGTTSACNGTNNLVTTAATRTITLTGGSLAAGGSCTFNVTVTGTVEGAYENITGFLSSNESGTSTSYATDTLTVIAPPNFEKSFSASSILTGANSVLQFTITNPNQGTALSGIGFTDTLPAGLTAVDGSFSRCNGTLDITGGNLLTFTGGSVNANSTCTFTVTVTGTTSGTKNNSTTVITSTEGGNGNAASATLVVSNPQPLIGLLKQISTDNTNWVKYVGLIPTGDIYYRFTITNDGETTLSNISVTDPNVNMGLCLPALPTSLAVGASASCVVGPISISAAPSPNPFVNTATATTSTYTPGTEGTSSAQYGTKSLSLDKTADRSIFFAELEVITYSYLVTNNGGYPLLGPVTVTDNRATVTCLAVSTVGDNDNYLDPGESLTCTATYSVSAGDVTVGQVTNIASASADGITSNPDSVTVTLAPDLTVSKTNNVSGTVALGSSFTWTLTVTNGGNTPATFTSNQTILSDPLPAGPTYGTPNAPANISCTVSAGTLTCTPSGPSVTIGAGGSFAVSFTVTPVSGASLSNTATVDPNNDIAETNNANNTGFDTVNVSAPDFSTVKTDNTPTYTPGTAITYTITVSNIGNDVANGTVTDNFPASLTNIMWSCTPSTACAAFGVGNINDSVSIPVGQFVTYTINATVLSNATGNLVNTGSAALSSGTDPTPGNNSSTDTDTPSPQSDLAITKTDGVVSVNAGGTTIYRIRVTNNGPSDVTGATLSDPAATGLSKTGVACSATPGQCLAPPSIVQLESGTLALPALASGQFYEITVTANVTATSGSVTNTATVAAPAGTTDPNPGNNTATDTDTVNPVADLAIMKTDGLFSYVPGNAVTYTVTVTNSGPSAAIGATITDTKPAQITTWAWVCTNQTGGATGCTPAASSSNNFSDSVDIPVGGSIIYTVTANTDSAATDNLVNTATVTVPAGTTDPIPGNNSSTDLDEPAPQSDLAIIKTDGSATYVPGAVVTYTVTVTNSGPSAARGATIADTKPTEITTWAWACTSQTGGATGCTPAAISSSNFSDTVDIPTGGSVVYTVTANTDAAATGNLVNTATVTVPVGTTDPTPANNTSTDTDSSAASPALGIVKSVTENSYANVGDVLHYSYQVTNNGNVTLSGPFSVRDDKSTDESCPPTATLAPGASITCTATYTVTQTDIDTGSLTNIASAQGFFGGSPVNSGTDTETVNATQNPALILTKTANPTSVTAAGDVVTYTFSVQNTGNVSLTNITLTDTLLSSLNCTTIASLAPGASQAFTCTGNTYTVTQTDIDNNGGGDSDIDNTATATGTTPSGGSTSDNDSKAVALPLANPSLTLTKTGTLNDNDGTPGLSAGDTISYAFMALNTGNVTLTNITLTDTVGGVTITGGPLATLLPGASDSTTFSGSYTITVTDINAGTFTNVASATGTPPSGPDVSDSDDDTQSLASNPFMVLTKTPTLDDTVVPPTGVANAGDTITYTFSVENTGNVTLTNIIVTDPLLPTLSCTIASLAPGATTSCTAANNVYTLTQADVNAGSRANTATATGQDPGNNPVTDPDTKTTTLNQSPSLNVVKEVSTDNLTWNDVSVNVSIGDTVYYRVRVTNNGNITLTNLVVDDGMAACTLVRDTDLTGDNDADFEAGEEWAYTCSVTAVAGTNNNTATADTTETPLDSDTASYTATAALVADPALSKAGNPTQATVGETVTFTLTLTNAGNTPAPNVVVTDPLPAMFDVTAVNVSGAPFGTLVNVTPPIGMGPAPYTVVVTLGGDLGVTDVVTITITTTVNSLGNPPINNNAIVSTSAQSDIQSNNSGTVTINLRPSDPTVSGSNQPALLPATGFAPEVETKLPPQPQNMMYAATDVLLEIPSLGVKLPIVGVPKKNGTWDVSWLGKQAGWLEGSAFPSWSGNSVLTSHVYASNGLPGPFVNLNKLKYGDQIIVHAYGQKYIFAVQTNQVVLPNDTSAFKHEEKSWLTLITCKEYDVKTNSYQKRVIVRAVLVKVVWDK